jgi:hypothetical protein
VASALKHVTMAFIIARRTLSSPSAAHPLHDGSAPKKRNETRKKKLFHRKLGEEEEK